MIKTNKDRLYLLHSLTLFNGVPPFTNYSIEDIYLKDSMKESRILIERVKDIFVKNNSSSAYELLMNASSGDELERYITNISAVKKSYQNA